MTEEFEVDDDQHRIDPLPPMTQTAPYPDALEVLVGHLNYKKGWTFTLRHLDRGQGSGGLTLVVNIWMPNSYHPEDMTSVVHYMPVPPAAYDVRNWQRWLFDQVLTIERHETMEFFTVDGVKPYAPRHGPGNDPYTVVDYGVDEDRRTSFRGEVKT